MQRGLKNPSINYCPATLLSNNSEYPAVKEIKPNLQRSSVLLYSAGDRSDTNKRTTSQSTKSCRKTKCDNPLPRWLNSHTTSTKSIRPGCDLAAEGERGGRLEPSSCGPLPGRPCRRGVERSVYIPRPTSGEIMTLEEDRALVRAFPVGTNRESGTRARICTLSGSPPRR
jgi:hypothetical protein